MSTYTELKGLRVKYLSSDPSPGTAGDVWYNTTDAQLKAYVGRGAWHAGATAIGGFRLGGGTGTQTAALSFGGFGPPDDKTESYEYNGSGWSTTPDLNTGGARFAACVGTQTAAVKAGGLLANINRWRGQIGLEKVDSLDLGVSICKALELASS